MLRISNCLPTGKSILLALILNINIIRIKGFQIVIIHILLLGYVDVNAVIRISILKIAALEVFRENQSSRLLNNGEQIDILSLRYRS